MSDRARKQGIAGEQERKMEQIYDKEEEAGLMRAIIDWIGAVLSDDPEVKPCAGTSYVQIHTYLKDGAVLCKLASKLLKTEGQQNVKYKKGACQMFTMMGNIQNFCDGIEKYGVNKEALFQSVDLVEGKKGPMMNVLNCLHTLGFVANSKKFTPAYTGQQTKFMDSD